MLLKQFFSCILLVLFAISLNAAAHKYHTKQNECGYDSCPKSDPNLLNIHIIAHSHDDVGWKKTFDQYYYGTKNYIHKAGVQYILDSAIQALLLSPERRFIYVETSFFWKWWQSKNEKVRESVRKLVNSGQLEIINGAWSMNDEAATHYQSTIDQFTWGFRILNETLGSCARPKIGWQIDPFGHSREQASIFAQLGFDGMFFSRLDYRDRDLRRKTKNMEFLWQGSQSLGSQSQIFTSILYENYMSPPGFCFDIMCSDVIVDDKNSPEYNAKVKAELFLQYVRDTAEAYKTNNVIVTLGGDFHYQEAIGYFGNIDRLMEAIKQVDKTVNIFYSTPSCYLKAVHDTQLPLSVKTDDFFPYASDKNSYWSGYFTSRPTSKRFERHANNLLQVSKQLAALSMYDKYEEAALGLNALRDTVGVMQHHDAITGTEKQHVADDYHRMLHNAMNSAAHLSSDALQILTQQDLDVKFQSCALLNISQCDATEKHDKFIVTIYNPLSRSVSHYVRLPVVKRGYQVYDSEGNPMTVQYVPIFGMILTLPGRDSQATEELVFKAQDIPALGYKLYFVKYQPEYKDKNVGYFKNKNIQLHFGNTSELDYVIVNNRPIPLEHKLLYYVAAEGDNILERASGAYIFRPQNDFAIPSSSSVNSWNITGPHVQEYHQIYNEWTGCVIRSYAEENYVEFNWIVGPIPVRNEYNRLRNDLKGKEVISRFTTNLQNLGVFYTDANGREMIKRIRDFRETFNLTYEEPVAQNYFPVTTKITIKDDEKAIRLSVLNDRAQGGSSLREGEIELMIHRRLLYDDDFGVEEPLDEMQYGMGLIATGKHYLMIHTEEKYQGSNTVIEEKELEQKILLEPWIFITPTLDNFDIHLDHLDSTNLIFSGLQKSLPRNVHILTLEPWGKNVLLLRLENFLEKQDDPLLSAPVTVNLENLFTKFSIKEIREMNLGADVFADEIDRLQWNTDSFYLKNQRYKTIKTHSIKSMNITLIPMEIKTFYLVTN